MELRSRHCVERRNGGIKGGDDLGVCPYFIVIPAGNRPDGLPFERSTGVVNRQPKFAAGTDDGADRAKPARISRPSRHRNVEPSDSEGSLTPVPLVGDNFAGTGQYGHSVIDASWLPADIPGRNRSGHDGH